MTSQTATLTPPFALGLFASPVAVPVGSRPDGEWFDPERQLTVLADGTPKALTANDDKSTTTGGLTSPTEQEWSVVFPGSGATPCVSDRTLTGMHAAAPFALGLFIDPVAVPVGSRPDGERFDPERQLTVLADGTPKALTSFADSTAVLGR